MKQKTEVENDPVSIFGLKVNLRQCMPGKDLLCTMIHQDLEPHNAILECLMEGVQLLCKGQDPGKINILIYCWFIQMVTKVMPIHYNIYVQ